MVDVPNLRVTLHYLCEVILITFHNIVDVCNLDHNLGVYFQLSFRRAGVGNL